GASKDVHGARIRGGVVVLESEIIYPAGVAVLGERADGHDVAVIAERDRKAELIAVAPVIRIVRIGRAAGVGGLDVRLLRPFFARAGENIHSAGLRQLVVLRAVDSL